MPGIYPFKLEPTRELLRSPDTYAFTLITILLAKYDTDFLEEEDNSVIFANVKDDFGVTLPEESENRISAAILAMATDLPFISFPVFESVALAMAEGQIGEVDDREDGELNTCELLWALTEIALLRGEPVRQVQEQLSDSVVDELNDIIDSEAEDIEDEEDDNEEKRQEEEESKEEGIQDINDAAHDPYYNRYVHACIEELVRQLKKLGVSPEICLEILTNYRGVDS